MSCGDGYFGKCGQSDGGRGCEFSRKPTDWMKAGGNTRSHGANHPPSTRECAESHGDLAAQDDPERDFVVPEEVHMTPRPAGVPCRDEQCDDDAHGLLSVIASMPQAVSGGRNKLQVAEHLLGPLTANT